jgi:hypothetical protein
MQADEFLGFESDDPLSACRLQLDRLHRDTAAEVGRRPVAPEMFSMLAMMLTSLPLVLLAQFDLPVRLAALEVAVVLPTVWLGAFLFQRGRYDRFQARCDRRMQHALATSDRQGDAGFLIFR